MRSSIVMLLITFMLTQACAQKHKNDSETTEREVGGNCEGCEAVYEYGSKKLMWIDTLPDFHHPGEKLEINGTIYHNDGITPARNVMVYIYHTNQKGEYERKGDETGWGQRHGYIRGWIKTGTDGKYKFYTLRPGAYPGGENPEHIHAIIKEPGIKPYWIDDYLFDDDPILTIQERTRQQGRGGAGIVNPVKDKNAMLIVRRDIVLGLNIPGYK